MNLQNEKDLEKKLGAFLKENFTLPEAPTHEYAKILDRLEKENKKHSWNLFSLKWLIPAIAAALIIFAVIPKGTKLNLSTDQTFSETFSFDEDSNDSNDLSSPSEDWIALANALSNSETQN